MEQLASFSLSHIESIGVELATEDVTIGLEEGNRSLIGKVFGEKKANLVGVKSSLMKIWQHRGLRKVVGLESNTFQFIFEHEADKDGILRGRPWFFDNQLLVLHPWTPQLKWHNDSFNTSPLWVQVWNVPFHWFSIDTGRKIGSLLGNTLNVLISDGGTQAGRHLKILVDIDLTKPLARGTKLKYQQDEVWAQFKYEQLPTFCYYCGGIGHNERVCAQRLKDLEGNCLKKDQFGPWLRASTGNWMFGGGARVSKHASPTTGSEPDTVAPQEGTEPILPPQLLGSQMIGSPSAALATSERACEREADGPKFQATDKLDQETASLEPIPEHLVLKDHMLVDIQPQSEQQSRRGNKPLKDTEQPELDVRHELMQKPHQDCTNRMQLQLGAVTGDLPLKTKGHWKRKARLQGKGDPGIDRNNSDTISEQFRKRDRRDTDQQVDLTPDSPTGKRGRMIKQQETQQISEVGETSHKWSQSIR